MPALFCATALSTATCSKQRSQRLSSCASLFQVLETQLTLPSVRGSSKLNMCCSTSNGSSPSMMSSSSASPLTSSTLIPAKDADCVLDQEQTLCLYCATCNKLHVMTYRQHASSHDPPSNIGCNMLSGHSMCRMYWLFHNEILTHHHTSAMVQSDIIGINT